MLIIKHVLATTVKSSDLGYVHAVLVRVDMKLTVVWDSWNTHYAIGRRVNWNRELSCV